MKTTKYIILLTLATLCTASCDDFLTTPSQSSLTTDNFYSNAAQMDQALTGIYGSLKSWATYYFTMNEVRSDNMFETTEAKQNESADCAQFNANGLLTDDIVNNCWVSYFATVASANTFLDNLEEATLETKIATQYEAEARFLRAIAYFDLIRYFGRIPAPTHELSSEEAFSLPQSNPLDVYNNIIIPDLRFAANNLQETSTDYLGTTHSERVSQIAAKAMLGKAYLHMAGFPLYQDTKSQATATLREVIDYATSTGKYWANDINAWNSMWIHENDNKWFIFEIQYACDANMGNPMTPLCRTSNASADDYCNGGLTVGSHVYIERDLQDHFLQTTGEADVEEGDTGTDSGPAYTDRRINATINMALSYDEETGTYTGGATDQNNFLVKFFEHKMKRSNLGYSDMDASIIDRTYWPQNFPLIRLEDIMLLYAECVGNTAEGYAMLNKIRNRAGLTTLVGLSDEAYREAVKQERRYELLGEGQRWFDEVRQNTYVEDSKAHLLSYAARTTSETEQANFINYAKRVTVNSYLYPIPQTQMQVRAGLYEQNPGY